MSENKRFYWIKLRTDFFNQDTMDFLLSQENGCEYIVLYQMLCLNTANNDGYLSSNIGEMIVPYDIKKIVRDTKYFTFDTVTIALGLFKQLGLIYEEDNKVLRINNFNEMVGSETSKAAIMRRKRAKEKELNSGNNVTKMLPECYVEIEKEKEIDKEIDIDKDKNKKKDIKKSYGEYKRIKLTDKEYEKLCNDFNKELIDNQIILLDEYVEANNNKNKYTNFNLVIRKSLREEWFKKPKPNASNTYKREEKVPNWFNEHQESKKPTIEEQEELDSLLNELQDDDFEMQKAALQEKLKNKYKKTASN